MPILNRTVLEILMKRILIRTVTEATRSTSPPAPRASTEALRPTPANVMPNRRASTSAEKKTRKWYSVRPFAGFVSSLSSTEKVNSPTRPKERDPSTISPCRRRPKWPLESIQPEADIEARPKKSAVAVSEMNQSPLLSCSTWPMPESGSLQIEAPPVQTWTPAPVPPTCMTKVAWSVMTSRTFSSPVMARRKPTSIEMPPGIVLGAAVVLRRSLPLAFIFTISSRFTSSATSR